MKHFSILLLCYLTIIKKLKIAFTDRDRVVVDY